MLLDLVDVTKKLQDCGLAGNYYLSKLPPHCISSMLPMSSYYNSSLSKVSLCNIIDTARRVFLGSEANVVLWCIMIIAETYEVDLMKDSEFVEALRNNHRTSGILYKYEVLRC